MSPLRGSSCAHFLKKWGFLKSVLYLITFWFFRKAVVVGGSGFFARNAIFFEFFNFRPLRKVSRRDFLQKIVIEKRGGSHSSTPWEQSVNQGSDCRSYTASLLREEYGGYDAFSGPVVSRGSFCELGAEAVAGSKFSTRPLVAIFIQI